MNDDVEEFFSEMDGEFLTLENVIKDALDIIEIYENKIDLTS